MRKDMHEFRDKMLQEISELASREGPDYDEILQWSAQVENEYEREEIILACIGKAIAVRASFIARATDEEMTQEGGMPASFILGTWAGWCMESEMEIEQNRLLRQMFGLGEN